jgi:hypothetical protein
VGGETPSVQLFSAVTREGVDAAQRMLLEWLGGEAADGSASRAHKKTPGTSSEATGAD